MKKSILKMIVAGKTRTLIIDGQEYGTVEDLQRFTDAELQEVNTVQVQLTNKDGLTGSIQLPITFEDLLQRFSEKKITEMFLRMQLVDELNYFNANGTLKRDKKISKTKELLQELTAEQREQLLQSLQ